MRVGLQLRGRYKPPLIAMRELRISNYELSKQRLAGILLRNHDCDFHPHSFPQESLNPFKVGR